MPTNAPPTSYHYFPVAQRDRDWGIFVTTIGESHLGPGTVYPPAVHPKGYNFSTSAGRRLSEYQIIYITAGQGWFESEKSGRLTVEAGDVLLLFPRVWHSYAPAPETGWDEHWVGFNGALVWQLVRKGFFSPARPLLRAGKENILLALFTSIMEAGRGDHSAVQQIMAGFVLSVLAYLYSVQQSRLLGETPGLSVIRTAITRMHEAGETPLNIPELARDLNVSYRWFRRAFVHHTGLSPHHYLVETRLARARDLLSQTSLSTKEIAQRVGFEDAQYFCRLFHKRVGLSPGAWRKHTLK